MGGNSCCFLWRNVACATLYGNDDECVEDFPQDDVDLEQFGSLEMAEAFATTAFADLKSAARRFMDAKKLVAQVKSARGFFPVVGLGAFDRKQSMRHVPPLERSLRQT